MRRPRFVHPIHNAVPVFDLHTVSRLPRIVKWLAQPQGRKRHNRARLWGRSKYFLGDDVFDAHMDKSMTIILESTSHGSLIEKPSACVHNKSHPDWPYLESYVSINTGSGAIDRNDGSGIRTSEITKNFLWTISPRHMPPNICPTFERQENLRRIRFYALILYFVKKNIFPHPLEKYYWF